MMNTDQLNLYGAALLDYFNGDRAATIGVYDERGKIRDFPLSEIFRDPAGFSELERAAVNLCRGRVLDIGSGNGRHSLALQGRGLRVTAIDILPQCVEVAKMRGVAEVYQADVFNFSATPFDTLLGIDNGFSILKTLDDLQPYLRRVRRLVKAGGQYVIHSTDVRRVRRLRDRVVGYPGDSPRRYFGEISAWLEYKGRRGETFTELYVDAETLEGHARDSGWECEVVAEEEGGGFLARLTPRRGH